MRRRKSKRIPIESVQTLYKQETLRILSYYPNLLEIILGSDLSLGVRSGPPEDSIASQLGNLLIEFVSQSDGEGHAFGSFIGGIPEHKALRIRILSVCCYRPIWKTWQVLQNLKFLQMSKN